MRSFTKVGWLCVIALCALTVAMPAEGRLRHRNQDPSQPRDQQPAPQKPQDQQTSPRRLPKALTPDSAISSGTLANGIHYYIVTNPTEPGLAEFALVRRHAPSEDESGSKQLARASITDIPRYNGQSSRDFLATAGAFATKTETIALTGLAQTLDNATIYRFGALSVRGRDAVVDSTILLIFNVIEGFQENGNHPKDYSTSDNAIIISGDITKDNILEKLNTFSLVVPPLTPDVEVKTVEYKWQPRDSVICTVETDTDAKTARLSISYSSPRTPEELMGTSLPVVSEHLGDILSLVLRKRLFFGMKEEGIPLSGALCRYLKSSDQPYDEQYQINVRIAPDRVEEACGVIARIVSDIDNYGIQPEEYNDARNEYLTKLFLSSMQTIIPNSTYVSRCISDFLYGATPISDSERCAFLTRRGQDTTRTRLFNNFAMEFLDSTRNLTIRLQTPKPTVTPEKLKTIYTSAWGGEKHLPTMRAVNQTDTVTFEKSTHKVRAKGTRTETVTGGTYWEFSNGMKVVYKRMDTEGMFYYNLMIRGGYSSMDGFSQGEGSFLNDILGTYAIGNLRSEDFHYLLLTNGITMSTEVKISDMSIYGTAKRASMTLLMKALTTMANERSYEPRLFQYYRESELLRLREQEGSLEHRRAVVDSLFCPAYRYGIGRTTSALRADMGERALEFFDEQFSKTNEGLLVIVGDQNEDLMKKFLSKNLGGFKTSGRISNRKRLSNFNPINGPLTFIEDGDRVSVDVYMSSELPYTADNYMAVKVAAVAVQDILGRSLCGTGAVARVEGRFESYPQERAVIEVNVETVDQENLPLDEDETGAVGLLFKIRGALVNPVIDSERLNFYKAIVKSEIDGRQNDPWYWIEMAKVRVSDVKDLNTQYSDKIDAVTADQVGELISTLTSGGKVEYLVR